MGNRAWYFGKIAMEITLFGSPDTAIHTLNAYMGGICDTLGGSSGLTFTYLPIIYEDDSQIDSLSITWQRDTDVHYCIRLLFV